MTMDEFEQELIEWFAEREDREFYSRPIREYLHDCERGGMRSRDLAFRGEVLA